MKMFTCPNCNFKSIRVVDKLTCTKANPIICTNCKATLKLPPVLIYAIIAGCILAVLLYPIFDGFAYVDGPQAMIWGYLLLAIAVAGYAILSKLTAKFELDNSQKKQVK